MNRLYYRCGNGARRPRAKITLLILVGAVVLSSCNLGAWKEEYRGVNLITNRGLSVASFADSYTGGVSPAFDYVNYEEILDSGIYGGGRPVFLQLRDRSTGSSW